MTRIATWCVLSVVVACAGAAPSDPSGPTEDSGGTGATDAGVRFCDAFAVIERKCQRCHHEPPANGAPFPLLSYDDTQVVERNGRLRYERMRDAVESDFMPATFLDLDPPVEPLEPDEKRILLDWLIEGAKPVGGTDCELP